jgi:hypothetical protein
LLQVLEQVFDQEPVHLVYLDPTADVLDEAGSFPRPEAAVDYLEVADAAQEIDVWTFRRTSI